MGGILERVFDQKLLEDCGKQADLGSILGP